MTTLYYIFVQTELYRHILFFNYKISKIKHLKLPLNLPINSQDYMEYNMHYIGSAETQKCIVRPYLYD